MENCQGNWVLLGKASLMKSRWFSPSVFLGCLLFYLINANVVRAEWEWQYPLPQGNDLHRVWGTSSSNVFAVGSFGTIMRYDGSSWTAMPSGTTKDLLGIWGSSGNDVFVVGTDATVLHYNGSAWSQMSTGSSCSYCDLVDVWGSSGSDVFAVSSGGKIIHYDGSSWTEMVTGTSNALNGVWGTSGSDVFVVGYGGTIMHYFLPLAPCPECNIHPVNLQNVTFEAGTNCECSDSASITIGSGVAIESGAKVIFQAPKITVKSGAQFKSGSEVSMKQE